MSQILTDDELQELTGAVYPSKQASILDQHGISYVRRLDGKLRVTWYSVNHPKKRDATGIEPDFSGFYDGQKKKAV